jgi:glyoxylase-like metal-dependent hydrolase (beta-lactamase superfamily II)
MPDDILDLADRLWRGEVTSSEYHPVGHRGGIAEICDGVAFVPSFANVSAFVTEDGLLLVDTGSSFMAGTVHEEIRRWSGQRLHTAVYSHGHIDHVFGMPAWEGEAAYRGWPAPVVVAHEALPRRFDRYRLTAGYNEVINRRQFGVKELRWPTEYRYPDRTYRDELELEVGGRRFRLRHEKGETDDHTVTWLADRKVLCCGDLFIWASPNAGNPQKVQRYPAEWASALRRMIALEPEYLLPGHGVPVVGADRVRQALGDTAELLETLVGQTLDIMNGGGRLDEAIHSVRPPAHLEERPYLRPVYDEPEFIVRNVWRLYAGWWDGNPATLKPAPERALAAELAGLAGGPAALADRALALIEQAETAAAQASPGGGAPDDGGPDDGGPDDGGPDDGGSGGSEAETARRLAGHLAELAWLAAPEDHAIAEVRRRVFAARADAATSTMARGIFRWTAGESS